MYEMKGKYLRYFPFISYISCTTELIKNPGWQQVKCRVMASPLYYDVVVEREDELVGIVRPTPMPPGPKYLPVLGNMFEYLHDQPSFLTHLQRRYGDVACFHLLHYPITNLSHPRHVRYILIENPRNFTVHETTPELQEFVGNGLLTIDGEEHRRQRRQVQPAFHKKQITTHADVMLQYTQEMLASWQPGQRIDMARAMQKLTMRIIMKCLFDIDLAYQLTELGPLFADVLKRPPRFYEQQALHLRLNLPFTRYGKQQSNKAHIKRMIHDLITERRAEGDNKRDVLSMLLFAGDPDNELDDDRICDHIMTFFGAGHETITNALCWTFYLLARHPTVLEKLQAELRTVLGGHVATLEDCAHLRYTEWVLNESMRLYPPVWTFGRHAAAAFELDGYHFPAGSFFMLSPWVIHRRPDLWEKAEQFRPERWHPERAHQIVPWSYIPFGAGPRICIGMPFAQLEGKLILATILQHYIPHLLPGYRAALQPWITLRPKHGMPMILEKV